MMKRFWDWFIKCEHGNKRIPNGSILLGDIAGTGVIALIWWSLTKIFGKKIGTAIWGAYYFMSYMFYVNLLAVNEENLKW